METGLSQLNAKRQATHQVALQPLRLLQSLLLARCQQCDRFANALCSRVRSLRDVNPNHEITPVRRRQLLKTPPRLRIGSEGLGNVSWQGGDSRLCRVAVVGWCRTQARSGKQASRFKLRPSFAVGVRPLALGLPRRDLESVTLVVEPLDQAVDPAETQRLAHCVLVGDRLHAGVALVENKPDARARIMVLREPGAPPLPAP